MLKVESNFLSSVFFDSGSNECLQVSFVDTRVHPIDLYFEGIRRLLFIEELLMKDWIQLVVSEEIRRLLIIDPFSAGLRIVFSILVTHNARLFLDDEVAEVFTCFSLFDMLCLFSGRVGDFVFVV